MRGTEQARKPEKASATSRWPKSSPVGTDWLLTTRTLRSLPCCHVKALALWVWDLEHPDQTQPAVRPALLARNMACPSMAPSRSLDKLEESKTAWCFSTRYSSTGIASVCC